jgi:hypothetical protein
MPVFIADGDIVTFDGEVTSFREAAATNAGANPSPGPPALGQGRDRIRPADLGNG